MEDLMVVDAYLRIPQWIIQRRESKPKKKMLEGGGGSAVLRLVNLFRLE